MNRPLRILLAAAAVLASGTLLAPPRRPAIVLTWTSSETNVFFNIRSIKTNQFAAPSMDWPIVATTTGHSIVLPIDKTRPSAWFAITAVDPSTGIESEFGHGD